MENVTTLPTKGIKLDYKTLNSEQFNHALAVLSNQTGFSNFTAAYNVAKIAKQFGEELKLARELYSKWSDEFVVKDESGKPKMAEKPHPLCPWEIKEGMITKFDEEMQKFLNTQVVISAKPLSIQDLGQIRLSPAQVLALEPIFDPSAFVRPESSAH